jgi:hypothetical protein
MCPNNGLINAVFSLFLISVNMAKSSFFAKCTGRKDKETPKYAKRNISTAISFL